MAKTFQNYSSAADSNTVLKNPSDVDIPLGENLMLPRHVNDAVRAVMADAAIDMRAGGRPAKTAETFAVKIVDDNTSIGSRPAVGGKKIELDGQVNPFLSFAGVTNATCTYTFDTSDTSCTGHLRFYTSSAQTAEHTSGVTVTGTAGTAGANTQIVINESTPRILYYQIAGTSGLGGVAITMASSEALANVSGAVSDAQAAQTAAATSATAAATSATAAATSATAAATSASSADTAKTGAESARDLAQTYKDQTFNYTYKTGNAPTNNAEYFFEQATAAKNDAVAAKDTAVASAAAAQAADDNNIYLGGSATNPTTLADGTALIAGAAYYNTSAGEVRFYSGSSWAAAGGGSSQVSANAANDLTLDATDNLPFFDLSAESEFTAVQTTANNASTAAAAAQTTANAALPAAGGTVSGNLVVSGDFTVNGTTTTVNTTNLDVADANITVAKNATGATAANGAGLTIGDYTNNPTFLFDGTNDQFGLNRPTVFKGDGTTTGQVGEITLNCSANTHGITVKSAPHADNANYDLVLPATITSAGGKVLAQNSGNTQLEFIDVLKPADIIDNLTSTSTTDVLSAAQGKALQDNKQAAITTSSGTINAQALTTQVGNHAGGNVSVDVRKANAKYSTSNLTAEPGASLVNMDGASLTLTLPSTLEFGDIITVYANPSTTGPVKIIQGSGGPSLRINGETSDVSNPTTTGVSVGNASIAVITMVGNSLAIISGSDLT